MNTSQSLPYTPHHLWIAHSPGRASAATFTSPRECAVADALLALHWRCAWYCSQFAVVHGHPLKESQRHTWSCQGREGTKIKNTPSLHWHLASSLGRGEGQKCSFPLLLPRSNRFFRAMIFMTWVPSGLCWGLVKDVGLFQVHWPWSSLLKTKAKF